MLSTILRRPRFVKSASRHRELKPMYRIVRIGFLLLLQCIAAAVFAQAPSPGTAPPEVPANTPLGSGPDPAIMQVDPGLPTHTLYRPEDLAAAGKMPVVVWGNGACWNAGNSFRWF